MHTDDALIIGCGYLGLRVAQLWRAQGRRVFALTRKRTELLTQLGIIPIVGDVLQPETLKQLPHAGTTLYAVGMDRTTGASMHDVYVDGLRHVLLALHGGGKLIYISSTSVYGQTDGSLVDEDSPTVPHDDSGKTVLAAEAMLHQHRADAVLLRFAGIYGPNRLLRKAAILAGQPLIGDADKFLNLIEVRDGARAVLAAEQRAIPGRTYIVSDGQPVPRRAFYTELASLLNAPPAAFEPLPEGTPPPPHDRGNRRLSNARFRLETGWAPEFADYRQGLAASVAESAEG
ncbi:SDR family oxidoreductase [Tuwongella immobilis]|uniref:NAD-dependent epimerase/dehydratase domain-containing protein n=1 Tax=Tuwongella immobilis TaxID=692036 RepID=A0A6C2YS10_9BACT|nr:SDR family oxidoreductase [Tuwongella immobilis]VIP04450.1 Uncharacterized protein OS=Planctomyces maris DSM 8797 GN=PM8797T_22148 PE=4 SV=1: NAD_binding_10 [Tuwongella immobilis]VTS06262.1 Uncharacterized protein OS=Planctomyces maris DSM 8797 GN=PM8797T_22148 PE=4 SV=1: NAD_binding_10 [Tuwongella immobilis]